MKNLQKTSYLYEEKLKAFHLKLGTRRIYLSPILVNISIEILASNERQKNKRVRDQKTRNKVTMINR